MKQPKEMNVVSIIDVDEVDLVVSVKERFAIETLAAVLMNFDSDGIKEYDEAVCALTGMGSYSYAPKRLDLNLKNRQTPPAKPSIEGPPILELKELPGHIRYVFLGESNTLPVVIATDLLEHQVEALVSVLKRYKRAIGWTIANIIGISLGICTHKIQLEKKLSPLLSINAVSIR